MLANLPECSESIGSILNGLFFRKSGFALVYGGASLVRTALRLSSYPGQSRHIRSL